MLGQDGGLVLRLVQPAHQLGQHLATGDAGRRPVPRLQLHRAGLGRDFRNCGCWTTAASASALG